MIVALSGGLLVLVLSFAFPVFGHAVLNAGTVVVVGWLGSLMLVVINKRELAVMVRVLVVLLGVSIIVEPIAGVIGNLHNKLDSFWQFLTITKGVAS